MAGLRIEGAVARTLELGFAELAALPGQIADVTALAPGREGGAVALRSVLDAAGLSAGAEALRLDSTDGKFSQEAPLDALGSAILVYRLGDAPLPPDRGGPIRFLIPNLESCNLPGVDRCTNVKALGRIVVS